MLSYDSPVAAHNTNSVNMSTPNGKPGSRQSKPNDTITMTHAAHVSSAAAQKGDAAPKFHHIWLVTGPAGCGKSTVAEHLAETLGLPYLEGDEVCTQQSRPPEVSLILT